MPELCFLLLLVIVAVVLACAAWSRWSRHVVLSQYLKEQSDLKARFGKAKAAFESADIDRSIKGIRALGRFLDGDSCHAEALALLTQTLASGEPRKRLAAAKVLTAFVERFGKDSHAAKSTAAELLRVMLGEGSLDKAIRSICLSGSVMADVYNTAVAEREKEEKLQRKILRDRARCAKEGHLWEKRPGGGHLCPRCYASGEHDYSNGHSCSVCHYDPYEDY